MLVPKMSASLGSPTLAATTAHLRSVRIPTQLRRWVPVYILGVIALVIFVNLDLYGSSGGGQHRGLNPTAFVHPPFTMGSAGKPLPPAQQRSRPRSDFPKKIWQTWKVGALAFERRDHETARSWTERNPDYRYEVLTDTNQLAYVEYHFGPEGFDRPDIVEFYKSVNAAIVRADLLRYMVMYAEGGVYADIDVESLRPMNKFIPERYNHADIDMVVGIEIDEPDWRDHPILGPKSRSFCQWTFMCKPQLPVMMRLIEQIMGWLDGVAERQNTTVADVKLDFDDIISGTGPSAFTAAIVAEMNAAAEAESRARGETRPLRPIEWDTFHDMSESKVLHRVLVLTVEAFAAGQGHSDSGNHEARAALVRHHYHASNWPSRHPRYKHPAYGEVEQCNWNDDCVHRWDADVAAFDKMSAEDQKKVVAEKEAEKQAEKEKKEAEEKRKKEDDERRRREDEKRKKEEEEEKRRKEEEAKNPPKKQGPLAKEEQLKADKEAKSKPKDEPPKEEKPKARR